MWKFGIVILAVMVVGGALAPVARACDIQGPGLKFCLEPLSPPVNPGDELAFTIRSGATGTAQMPAGEPGYALYAVFLVGSHGHRLVVLAEKRGLRDVFTLDQADFRIYRLQGRHPFRLWPRDL